MDTERIVDEVLARDPIGVFTSMEWETRVRYHQVVRDLARYSGLSPAAVANQVLTAAQSAANDPSATPAATHVGYYLIGSGSSGFRHSLPRRLGPTAFARAVPSWWSRVAYAGLILLGVLAQAWIVIHIASPLETIPASVVIGVVLVGLPLFYYQAVQVAQTSLHWLFPLRLLPKVVFEKGIPDGARTLVVVPTILKSAEHAREQVARLQELSSVNQSANIRFALLSDFRDNGKQTAKGDEEILEELARATESLNAQHRDLYGDKFFVLHRERLWNPSEGVWMGWERKRGKLQELNRALRGYPAYEHFRWVFGDFDVFVARHPIQYVLTLDDTTCLEKGEAERLIMTAAHPLNRPVFDPGTGRITEGYGMLQPSIVPAPPLNAVSRNAMRFGHKKVPPRFMRGLRTSFAFDAFGAGSFAGKALYDVDAVRACLEGELPVNYVLSHDRIEGLYVRTGEVCDSFVTEPLPGRYLTAFWQRHRWSRGDTQLLRWLLPRVPDGSNRLRPNQLPLTARLGIASLFISTIVAPSRLAFLLACWTFIARAPYVWPLMAFATVVWRILHLSLVAIQGAVAVWWAALGRRNLPHTRPTGADLWNALVALLLLVAFLPLDAFVNADAVVRSFWRMLISHEHLLEWTAQHEVERAPQGGLREYWRFGWPSTLVGLLTIAAVVVSNPHHQPGITAGCLWTAAFVICWYMDTPPRGRSTDRVPE